MASCEKEDPLSTVMSRGATILFNADIEGASLKIQSGDAVGIATEVSEGEFYAELGREWAYVYYYPDTQMLHLYIGKNTTGRARWFVVSGTHDGQVVSFTYKQKG